MVLRPRNNTAVCWCAVSTVGAMIEVCSPQYTAVCCLLCGFVHSCCCCERSRNSKFVETLRSRVLIVPGTIDGLYMYDLIATVRNAGRAEQRMVIAAREMRTMHTPHRLDAEHPVRCSFSQRPRKTAPRAALLTEKWRAWSRVKPDPRLYVKSDSSGSAV